MQKKKKGAENFYFKSGAFGNPDQKKKLLLPEMGVTRKVFTREAANLFFNQFPGDILFPSLVSSHFFVFLGFFCLFVFVFSLFFLYSCFLCLFVFVFSLLFLFVCVCLFLSCFCILVFLFVCVCFLKLRKYVLIHIRLCASVNDKKISPDRFSETRLLFLAPAKSR